MLDLWLVYIVSIGSNSPALSAPICRLDIPQSRGVKKVVKMQQPAATENEKCSVVLSA